MENQPVTINRQNIEQGIREDDREKRRGKPNMRFKRSIDTYSRLFKLAEVSWLLSDWIPTQEVL